MKIKSLLIKFFNLGFYTSKIDQFLDEYSKKNHDLSLSQRLEIAKYDRIQTLRDQPCPVEVKKSFWEKF